MKGDATQTPEPSADGVERWTERQKHILEAALEIVEVEGIAGLSMRRLAGTLGVDAAALYWHFRNKEELLSALTLFNLERVELELPAAGPWRERCSALCRAMREQILKRPEIVLLEAHGNLLAPFNVRASGLVTRVLLEGGFSGRRAILAGQTLMWHVVGVTRIEVNIPEGPPPPAVVRAMTEETAEGEPGDLAERLRALPAEYERISVANLFDYGLECILDGIEAELASAGEDPPG
ncbi:MAG: TetR family transcriptional regulator [Deltaproteobacteria bacterium]|nr:TetR family transcriptional regulator [Deltaproteobacteria bacterium]